MIYIVVDNTEKFTKLLLNHKKSDYTFISSNEKELNELANEIIKKTGDKIIFINAELKNNRADYNGIELLKKLRIIHKELSPIVLYGFSALNQILQNHPNHLILTSKGNKYIQLPTEVDNFIALIDRIKPLSSIDELIENYKIAVKADFDITEIDHSFANEYGLELMFRAHQGVVNKKLSISNGKYQELKEQMSKSDFLYSYTKNQMFKSECQNLRTRVVNHINITSKRIVCIDDQGNDGWFHFFKSLLSDNDAMTNFFPITPQNDEDINKAIKKSSEIFINQISAIQPDLVLLDLRLYGDREKNKKIEDISGYIILKTIKDQFPALPIIVTSATNKSDNLTALLKADAFGLWSKPRIEQGNIDIYEKYLDLLSLINNALTFYRYEEEKIPIKADYLINNIETLGIAGKEYLGSYDLIITDTNCWMMGLRTHTSVEEVAKLYKNIVLTGKIAENSTFLIIDDIKRELSDHLHKITNDSAQIAQLEKNAIMADYGIKLLNKIIIEKRIWVYDSHLTNYRIGDKFKFKYSTQGNLIIESCYDVINNNQLYSREYYIIDSEYEIKLLLKRLNKRKKVHADVAFINILYHFITLNNETRRRNILFISDDTDCRDNVYFLLNNKLNFTTEEDKKMKIKYGVNKVVSGVFKGSINGNEDFSLTIMDPFTFSSKIESLITNTP